MRILGFQKKWAKLNQPEFTTFRYGDWAVGERIQIVIQPRRKGGGEKLGIAEIISAELREFDSDYYATFDKSIPLITEAEAIIDGFASVKDMIAFMEKTYGRLDWLPLMTKYTLKWIER